MEFNCIISNSHIFSIFLFITLSFPLHIQSQESWRKVDDAGNYSNYNESCSLPSNQTTSDHGQDKLCNSAKLLTCSPEDNRCICAQDPNDTDHKVIYDAEKEACVPMPKTEAKAVIEYCTATKECWSSHYGEYSRCLLSTGKCECYDTVTNGQQPVVLIDGTCYLQRNRGDFCETNEECNATIVGEAICVKNTIQYGSLGTCDCAAGSFWDNRLQECLGIADTGLHFTCKSDLQCNHIAALGNLSRCNEETRKCQCFDVNSNGKSPTAEFEGKCYLKLRVNETCEKDIECKLGSGQPSTCKQNDDHYGRHCECHDTHVWGETHVEDEEQCLLIGELNSRCTSDNQCQHQNGLGPLSKCAKIEQKPTEGQCICWDPVTQAFDNTGFANGACHYKKAQNEVCTKDEECIAGWSPNARCLEHPSYNGEKVCQCPEGIVCKSGAGTFSAKSTLFYLVLIMACRAL